MSFGYSSGIPSYWHIIAGISLVLVIISNMSPGVTLIDSVVESALNFDASLTKVVDDFVISKNTGMTKTDFGWSLLLILAHIMLFVYIFMVLRYSFPTQGFFSTLFFTGITVWLLHLIYFIFFNKQGLSKETLFGALPFTGILHLLKIAFTNPELFKTAGLVDNSNQVIAQTNQSVNATTQGYDFDIS